MFGHLRKWLKKLQFKGIVSGILASKSQRPANVFNGKGVSNEGFAERVLESARDYAIFKRIPVGGLFDYSVVNIPEGRLKRSEVMCHIVDEAGQYDLRVAIMMDKNDVLYVFEVKSDLI